MSDYSVESSIDFGNSSLWNLVYQTQLKTTSTTILRNTPIGVADLPVILHSPLIAIYTSSDTAKETWRSAGYMNQKVLTGITVSNTNDADYGDSHRLLLRQVKVFLLPWLNTYSLRFTAHKWLRDVSLKLWEYTGEIKRPNLGQIDNLRIDVLRVEAQVQQVIRMQMQDIFDIDVQ